MRIYKRFLVLLGCSSLFFVSGESLSGSLPPLSAYGNLPEVSMMQISPNGHYIAYRKKNKKIDAIIVTDLQTNETVFAGDVSEIKPRNVLFASNNFLIVIGAEFANYYGSKAEFSALYSIDLQHKKVRKLLSPDSMGVIQSGYWRVVGVSPDHTSIYVPGFFSRTKGGDADAFFNLLRLPIYKKMSPFMHAMGSKSTKDFFVDKNGKAIAKALYVQDRHLTKIYSRLGDSWKEIYSENDPYASLDTIALSADGQNLYIEEDFRTADQRGLKIIPLQGGELKGPFFHKRNLDLEETYLDVQRVLYGVRYSGFTQSYEFIDPVLHKKINSIVARLPDNSAWLSAWTPDWKNLVFRVEGKLSAGAYILFKDGEKPRKLADIRPSIKTSDIKPILVVDYSARDGMKIPTLLTFPVSNPEQASKLPAILLPHGGPESHSEIRFDWIAQYFASRGYLVIQPQFRGSDGFGDEHRWAGYNEWGRKMQDDLTDSVKSFVSAGIVDPARICIVGLSYGGYAALAGGAFTPELYQCVVSISGISDLNLMSNYRKRRYGKNSKIFERWQKLVGADTITKKELWDLSPVNFAEKFNAPVLLIHASDDIIVPINQSKKMLRALKGAKKTVNFKKLKGEDHWLSIGETRLRTLEATAKFVDRYLKNKP